MPPGICRFAFFPLNLGWQLKCEAMNDKEGETKQPAGAHEDPPSLASAPAPGDAAPGDAAPGDAAPSDPGRRSTMKKLVVVGSAIYGGSLAVPAVAFLAGSENKTEAATFRRLIAVSALKDGEATRVAVVGEQRDAFTRADAQILGSVWLQRRGKQVVALAAECPHLGCAISNTSKGFACPCHTSAFDPDGKAKSGPSPRDMDQLESRIKDGFVEVKFVHFKQGSKKKEVVA